MSDFNETAKNRILILYLLNSFNFKLSENQLVKFLIENRLMHYFILKDSLAVLCSDNLVEQAEENSMVYYTITDKGNEHLSSLEILLPKGLKTSLDSLVEKNRKLKYTKPEIQNDIEQISENEYVVSLYANEEDKTVFSATLNVTSYDMAKKVAEIWKKNSADIYAEFFNSIINKMNDGK